MHRVVRVRGYYARRLAPVGQPHGAGAYRAYVVDGDFSGKDFLTAHGIRRNYAIRYEQLRLFNLLLRHVVRVGWIFAVGYGDIQREALLLLLAQYVEVVRPQRDGVGAVYPPLHKRYFKHEHIPCPAGCGLGIVAEYEGAVRRRAKVGRYSHLAVIRLADKREYNVAAAVHYAGHIALLVCSIHAVVQIPAVYYQLVRHRGRLRRWFGCRIGRSYRRLCLRGRGFTLRKGGSGQRKQQYSQQRRE